MGLLDNLESQAMASMLGGNSSPLAASIVNMIKNRPGGLQGLVQSFHDKGLGGLISAWVSTGPNPPMTTDQVHQTLGVDKVKELAAAAGISPDMATSTIAQLLPGIVDSRSEERRVGKEWRCRWGGWDEKKKERKVGRYEKTT